MGDTEDQGHDGVPSPNRTLIAGIDAFFTWVENSYREGRDHRGDFRRCLGLSANDFSNWKSAVWTGKNPWSRQIAVTERLLATLTYEGVHPAYQQKGRSKNVRGSDWPAYTNANGAPSKAIWDEITSEKVSQVEQYYRSLIEAQKSFELQNALRGARSGTGTSDEQAAFATALTKYVALLVRQGKMKTVLDIRESMSHLLHLLGENQTRCAVGEYALMAAVETESTLDRAQILVDDLGWAAHMLQQDSTARENIQSGIKIANGYQTSNVSDLIEARLTAAKGYRHLAMMAEDEDVCHRYLNQAEQVISDLSAISPDLEHFKDTIARDKAQVDHARATIIARSLGVLDSGTISKDDTESADRATQALTLASQATVAFEAIADFERLNKALVLEERLHMALGHRTSAIETLAKRQKIARSLSVRKQ